MSTNESIFDTTQQDVGAALEIPADDGSMQDFLKDVSFDKDATDGEVAAAAKEAHEGDDDE